MAVADGFPHAGGVELVPSCDLVPAADESDVSHSNAPGLIANRGPVPVLRPTTCTIAIQVRLTGEPLGAERACTPGPVNPLVDLGAAEIRALTVAAMIAVHGRVIQGATPRALADGDGERDERGRAAPRARRR